MLVARINMQLSDKIMELDLLLNFELQHSQSSHFWKQVDHFPDKYLRFKGNFLGEGRLSVIEVLNLLVFLFQSRLSFQIFPQKSLIC